MAKHKTKNTNPMPPGDIPKPGILTLGEKTDFHNINVTDPDPSHN